MESIHGAFDALQANTWTMDVCYRVFVSADRAVGVRTGGQLAAQGSQAVIAHQFGLNSGAGWAERAGSRPALRP